MLEIKVRLSMSVPGAQMLSSQDCEKMSKKDAYDYSTLVVSRKEKKGKKSVIKKETLHINTRKSKPAKQCVSISKEAYDYMTDAKEIPSSKLVRTWANMSKAKRLEYHLSLIAESFNALSYTYEIFDD